MPPCSVEYDNILLLEFFKPLPCKVHGVPVLGVTVDVDILTLGVLLELLEGGGPPCVGTDNTHREAPPAQVPCKLTDGGCFTAPLKSKEQYPVGFLIYAEFLGLLTNQLHHFLVHYSYDMFLWCYPPGWLLIKGPVLYRL